MSKNKLKKLRDYIRSRMDEFAVDTRQKLFFDNAEDEIKYKKDELIKTINFNINCEPNDAWEDVLEYIKWKTKSIKENAIIAESLKKLMKEVNQFILTNCK